MSQARPKLAVFVDHNVAESAARAFEAAGHAARRLRHALPQDAPDDLVAATAAAADEMLLTHDKDFRQVARRAGSAVVHPKRLSIIGLRCPEFDAARRLTAVMSLIEHEWNYAIAFGNGLLHIEIHPTLIRVLR